MEDIHCQLTLESLRTDFFDPGGGGGGYLTHVWV